MGGCVFCSIVAGTAPADVVARWPETIAIVPPAPVTEGHVLVIPHRHVADVAEDPAVSAMTMRRAAELAGRVAAANVITSRGADATQTVFHLHLHVVPRRRGDGLPLPWSPGRGVPAGEPGPRTAAPEDETVSPGGGPRPATAAGTRPAHAERGRP